MGITKLNVALNMREQLIELYENAKCIDNFIGLMDDLEWAADSALKTGVQASRGKSNIVAEYTIFVRGLYDFWAAKKSTIGVYKGGGHWTGPFVELIARCEEILPPYLRPPSANARGERVARAIGADKKDKRFLKRRWERVREIGIQGVKKANPF